MERVQALQAQQEELNRKRFELEMARDVQRRLLPPSELAGPGWEVAARCVPARVVEVNQGPAHTEKGYHQCLKPELWDHPDLQRPAFADDKY